MQTENEEKKESLDESVMGAMKLIEEEKKDVSKFGFENGGLEPKNIQEAYRFANMVAQSGMLPPCYRDGATILTGMQFAKELGVPGISALKNILVLKGIPTLWGDLPLAIVKRSGKLKLHSEYPVDDKSKKICEENGNLESKVIGVICKMERTDGNNCVTFFGEKMALAAGLLGRESKVYEKYPHLMYKYRARSECIKSLFADLFYSFNFAEYHNHILPEKGIVETENLNEANQTQKRISDKIRGGENVV